MIDPNDVADDIQDQITGRGFRISMRKATGESTMDAREARRFFDKQERFMVAYEPGTNGSGMLRFRRDETSRLDQLEKLIEALRTYAGTQNMDFDLTVYSKPIRQKEDADEYVRNRNDKSNFRESRNSNMTDTTLVSTVRPSTEIPADPIDAMIENMRASGILNDPMAPYRNQGGNNAVNETTDDDKEVEALKLLKKACAAVGSDPAKFALEAGADVVVPPAFAEYDEAKEEAFVLMTELPNDYFDGDLGLIWSELGKMNNAMDLAYHDGDTAGAQKFADHFNKLCSLVNERLALFKESAVGEAFHDKGTAAGRLAQFIDNNKDALDDTYKYHELKRRERAARRGQSFGEGSAMVGEIENGGQSFAGRKAEIASGMSNFEAEVTGKAYGGQKGWAAIYAEIEYNIRDKYGFKSDDFTMSSDDSGFKMRVRGGGQGNLDLADEVEDYLSDQMSLGMVTPGYDVKIPGKQDESVTEAPATRQASDEKDIDPKADVSNAEYRGVDLSVSDVMPLMSELAAAGFRKEQASGDDPVFRTDDAWRLWKVRELVNRIPDHPVKRGKDEPEANLSDLAFVLNSILDKKSEGIKCDRDENELLGAFVQRADAMGELDFSGARTQGNVQMKLKSLAAAFDNPKVKSALAVAVLPLTTTADADVAAKMKIVAGPLSKDGQDPETARFLHAIAGKINQKMPLTPDEEQVVAKFKSLMAGRAESADMNDMNDDMTAAMLERAVGAELGPELPGIVPEDWMVFESKIDRTLFRLKNRIIERILDPELKEWAQDLVKGIQAGERLGEAEAAVVKALVARDSELKDSKNLTETASGAAKSADPLTTIKEWAEATAPDSKEETQPMTDTTTAAQAPTAENQAATSETAAAPAPATTKVNEFEIDGSNWNVDDFMASQDPEIFNTPPSQSAPAALEMTPDEIDMLQHDEFPADRAELMPDGNNDVVDDLTATGSMFPEAKELLDNLYVKAVPEAAADAEESAEGVTEAAKKGSKTPMKSVSVGDRITVVGMGDASVKATDAIAKEINKQLGGGNKTNEDAPANFLTGRLVESAETGACQAAIYFADGQPTGLAFEKAGEGWNVVSENSDKSAFFETKEAAEAFVSDRMTEWQNQNTAIEAPEAPAEVAETPEAVPATDAPTEAEVRPLSAIEQTIVNATTPVTESAQAMYRTILAEEAEANRPTNPLLERDDAPANESARKTLNESAGSNNEAVAEDAFDKTFGRMMHIASYDPGAKQRAEMRALRESAAKAAQ